MRKQTLTALLGTGVLLGSLAACGGDDDGGGGSSGASGEPIVVGTTDTVTSTDPAGQYDLGSGTLILQTYQTLLAITAGGATPEPDAAESCDWADAKGTTYVCTLKEGLTFHDGSDLTAEDVVYSFDRLIEIEDVNGGYTLLTPENLESVEATGDLEVTMQLKEPDATWPFRLTTTQAAIVPSDSDTYPADELAANGEVVGSGPYEMEEYEDGQTARLVPFEDYGGPAEVKNGGAIMTYFPQESALALAVENGDVDVAYRSLSPTTVEDLSSTDGLEIVEGEGSEIRYIVFNTSLPPGKDQAARQAMASLIDREALAKNVYNDTVKPLYSMVPEGLEFATKAFADEYGETPDPGARGAAPEGRRHPDAGRRRPVVDTDALRFGVGRRVRGARAPVRGRRAVRRHPGLRRVEPVQRGERAGPVPGLPAGLVPGLPGRRQLHLAVLLRGWLLQQPLQQRPDQRADHLRPRQHRRRRAGEDVRRDPADRGRGGPDDPGLAGQAGVGRRRRRHGVEDTFDPSFSFRMWMISKS